MYLKFKWGPREIGRRLKRDPGVISREIKRNSRTDDKYVASDAQKRATFKSRKTNRRKLETNEALHDWVEKCLKEGWSPELISGKLKEQPPKTIKGATISHEQIYEYIYEGEGKWEGWYHYLVRKQPKRRKQRGRKPHKTTIKERVPISARPEVINTRERFGDWESDLAVFRKQKEVLSVQYERKGMLTKLHKVANKTAKENEQALMKTLEDLPPEYAKSVTFDNGTENVCHTNIRDTFNLETFFCKAYAAWQKGGVENTIGIIRRHLPKSTDLAKLTDDDIYKIQEKINNRPRKKLNFRTPNEVLQEQLSVALNS